MEQARERFQELAEAEEKYISANIENRTEALAAVEGMMRELDLTQSQYEAIRDALIAQNVISAAAGQAYAGTWEDLLYGDLAEYGVGYAPVLGNIYFAKSWRARAAAKQAAASGSAISGGALPPDNNDKKDPELKEIFNSIKEAPNYPQDFIKVQNGTKKVTIKNDALLEKLREIAPGEWKKVYQNGYSNGQQVSIHYFQHTKTGMVFNVKVKLGWSTGW